MMMLLNDNSQVHRFRAYSIGIAGVLQNTFSFIPNYYALKEENELLRKLNVNLADEVNQLRESKLENIKLRSFLNLKDTSNVKLIATKIIAKNLTMMRNTITIDKGLSSGIKIGNPIVTGDGLVGRVINASDNYSLIQLMLNVDFRASAKDQRSRVDGIILWNGKKLILNNVAQTLDVKPGDAIITSQYSNAFPQGIKIGVVQSAKPIDGKLFQEIVIAPAVNFTRLEEVFVLDYFPSLEKIYLEDTAIK